MNHHRLIALALLAALACMPATGCARRPTAVATPEATTAEDIALQSRIADLDRKIGTLEQRLGSGSPSGNGAYARGTTLHVEGDGKESLLEKLRRLERELAAATATAAAKDATIANIAKQRDAAMATSREVGERADYLTHTSESLIAAQQTLSERQERIDALGAQLAAAELQRLRSERRWYQLASEILRLSPDDARDLPGIQSRIRQATREVREDTGAAGAKP